MICCSLWFSKFTPGVNLLEVTRNWT